MSTAENTALDRLACAIKAGQACHALFISCPDEALSYSAARRVSALICTGGEDTSALDGCADYFELQGSDAKAAAVRELLGELNHRPTGLFGRAIAVLGAHRLSEQIQNILLKSIEEPPAGTMFVLTGNAGGVLPTIASRCCVVRLGLPGEDSVEAALAALGADGAAARLYAAQSGGSIARGRRLYEDEAYRTLRSGAQEALFAVLEGGLPASAAKNLAKDAGEAVSFMLSAAGDMLCVKLGATPRENPEREGKLRELAKNFTLGRLTCIIDMLSRANADVVRGNKGWYYAVPALNRLFLDMAEVVAEKSVK